MDGLNTFNDSFDLVYEVVSRYENGFSILHDFKGTTKCPWVIRTPDNRLLRFKTENDLWQYALEKQLFKRKG